MKNTCAEALRSIGQAPTGDSARIFLCQWTASTMDLLQLVGLLWEFDERHKRVIIQNQRAFLHAPKARNGHRSTKGKLLPRDGGMRRERSLRVCARHHSAALSHHVARIGSAVSNAVTLPSSDQFVMLGITPRNILNPTFAMTSTVSLKSTHLPTPEFARKSSINLANDAPNHT